jgi:hypothetical protein
VALRLDAANLLWSYRDSLNQGIIPNYHPKGVVIDNGIKPGPTPDAVFPGLVAKAAAEARLKAAEADRSNNEFREQMELNASLRRLDRAAASLIIHDFSWPPRDDATVTKLLDTFPNPPYSRVDMLAEVANKQQERLHVYGTPKEKAAGALQNAK